MNTDSRMRGQIDELSMWNVQKDPKSLFNVVSTQPIDITDTSLVLHYNFDEGTGDVAKNLVASTGSNYDLILGYMKSRFDSYRADDSFTSKKRHLLHKPTWSQSAVPRQATQHETHSTCCCV